MAQPGNRTSRLVIKQQPSKPIGRLVKKKSVVGPSTIAAANHSPCSHNVNRVPQSDQTGSSPPKTKQYASPKRRSCESETVRRRSVLDGRFATIGRPAAKKTTMKGSLKATSNKENDRLDLRDNFEEKIRHALTLHEVQATSPHSFQSNDFGSDPAIVSYGPLARSSPRPTSRLLRGSPIKVSAKPLALNNQIDGNTPRNDLGTFKQRFDTIVKWHDMDHRKFLKLLDVLKESEASETSIVDNEIGVSLYKDTTIGPVTPDSTRWLKLDPRAKPFSSVRAVRTACPDLEALYRPFQQSIDMPRVRPRLQLDIASAVLHQRSVQNPYFAIPPPPSNRIYSDIPRYCSPSITPFPPIFALPLGPFEPIIDDDDEPGRTARAQNPEFGAKLLETFRAKHPMTGMLKSESQVSSEGRRAAAIQLRLEILLLQKKEKEARDRLEMSRGQSLEQA